MENTIRVRVILPHPKNRATPDPIREARELARGIIRRIRAMERSLPFPKNSFTLAQRTMSDALLQSTLPFPVRRGKVRDVYDLGAQLLIVATDRISAFDCIMPNGIPGKGKI